MYFYLFGALGYFSRVGNIGGVIIAVVGGFFSRSVGMDGFN
jgi:hypothetical protein